MGPSTYARVAEITSGRAITQQGLTATCKDLPNEASSQREQEGLGLAHEPVRAMKEG